MKKSFKNKNGQIQIIIGLVLVILIIIAAGGFSPHKNTYNVQKNEESAVLQENPSVNKNQGTFPTLTLYNTANAQSNKTIVKTALTALTQAQEIQKGKNSQPIDMSSEGLARYFSEQMNCQVSGSKLFCINGYEYIFVGDGSCNTSVSCYVTIDVNGEKGPNEEWTEYEKPKDRVNVPIEFEYGNLKFKMPSIVE